MAGTIDKDYKLDDISLIKYLKEKNSPFLGNIADIYNSAKEILNNRIAHIFPNFTLHNVGHSFRIMEYMNKILASKEELNELEITLLIYSALLHDIGMAVSTEDITLIKANEFPHCDIRFSAMVKLMNGDENEALQEYVRRIHSKLSANYILTELKDKLTIPNYPTLSFADDLALICQSHTEDFEWIQRNLKQYEVKGDYPYNPQYIACLLRLGDILDIDSNRTPYNLYKLIEPTGMSDAEWQQHYVISNNEKIIFNDKTQQKKIVFHGKVSNPSIHRKILNYISWVENELTNSTSLTSNFPPQYRLIFENIPEQNIQTEGYTYSGFKMTLVFKAISSLLMGEKIYGHKSLGLRELIQNSIDACKIREEIEKQKHEFGQDEYVPKIKVILNSLKKQVTIKDNGIGMTNEVLKKHFLNIGVSYYNSPEFLLKDFDYKPIGNFGIGFLSCFMLSEKVTVSSRYFQSKNKYTVDLEKGDEFTSFTEKEDVSFEGTEVILNYDDFIGVFNNNTEKVKEFLKSYFLTDGIEFEVVDTEKQTKQGIFNLLNIENNDAGLIKIPLQNYLEDIDGYALIKARNSFIKKFDDLDFTGDLFTYDEETGITEVTDLEKLSIDDYIKNKEIQYLSIPLVESSIEDDFLNGLKFTGDDIDKVIEKMDRELRWISVILPNTVDYTFYEDEISVRGYIFNNFNFEDLVKLGHSSNCKTKSFVNKIKIFEGKRNELYLPFDEQKPSYYYWGNEKERKELYLRSVLIKEFRFNLPLSATIFDINTIVVNIKSRKFIPDISRNNVDNQAKDIINYIIGKAIHIGAHDLLPLNIDEKDTLKNFINHYYEKKTEFEK